jgi:hypothetical protein
MRHSLHLGMRSAAARLAAVFMGSLLRPDRLPGAAWPGRLMLVPRTLHENLQVRACYMNCPELPFFTVLLTLKRGA